MLGAFALALAAAPLALACDNLRRYRVPAPARAPSRIAVLIPARNEEANIGAAVAAVLASEHVDLELHVLDDASTDGTAAILAGIADPRLHVARAPALPAGWCGKQHACAALARRATAPLLVFLDADVRLAPDALARISGHMDAHPDQALASGFPRQITRGWAEKLLLPLIHVLLLGYLPMGRMARSRAPGFGAGCGQLMAVRAGAYAAAGGHAAVRGSLHDGVTLPRAFRRAGFLTGLFDATPFAACRMYESARGVWQGLSKNATEGMAQPVALPIWTALLAGGHILPFVLVAVAPTPAAWLAVSCSLGLRLLLAQRFRQSRASALLSPIGIAALLALQWWALAGAALGRKAVWRGREYAAP